MRIAILGAGNIGGTIGRKWIAAGHDVSFGVRSPEKYADLVALGAQVGSAAEAIAGAQVVLLSVPGAEVAGVLAEVGPALGTAVVLDASNNLAGGGAWHAQAAIAEVAPDARYARAFNSMGWEVFDDAAFPGGERADMFIAVADDDTRSIVEALVIEVGPRPICLGGLDQLDALDAATKVWFGLIRGAGYPRHTALRVVTD